MYEIIVDNDYIYYTNGGIYKINKNDIKDAWFINDWKLYYSYDVKTIKSLDLTNGKEKTYELFY